MGTPELPNLRQHCYVADCNQIHFVPLTCDRCHQEFCVEHLSFRRHNCPKPDEHGVTVVICPICAKGVRLIADEDPNIAWQTHNKTVCDPVNNKRKRPVSEPIRNVKCKDCDNEHKCPGKPSEVGQSSRGLGPGPSTSASTSESQQWKTNEVCLRCDESFTSITELAEHVEDVHEPMDVCPKCNRVFADPVALVEHVEMEHATT